MKRAEIWNYKIEKIKEWFVKRAIKILFISNEKEINKLKENRLKKGDEFHLNNRIINRVKTRK